MWRRHFENFQTDDEGRHLGFAQIVKAVVMHEAALKAQAKKMNVESLRSGDQSGESAEIKIAKVCWIK